MESLDRFTRTGSGSNPRFLGPVHAVFFRRFHGSGNFFPAVSRFGPVRNLSRTVPVSDPVPCDSGAVRFRVTRPVAIPICHNGVIYKGFINNLGNFMYKLIFKNKIPKRSS